MIKNFLTIALRNISRQKGYTFLNIFGLTIGITCSLFILLYLNHELNFDQHHQRVDRIFRISSQITEPDDSFRWSVTQTPLGPALQNDYPEVEEFVRFIGNGNTTFILDGKEFIEEKVFFVDSSVFDVFTFNLLSGDPHTALIAPKSVVLSKSVADRIFGGEDPLGKTLMTDDGSEEGLKVTGVYQDMPANSHIIAHAMISQSTIAQPENPGSWGGFGIYTYVLLKDGAKPADFAAKLPEVVEKYVAVIFDQYDITVVYTLLPIRDIHLTSDFQGEPEPTGEMAYIYLFGIVGIFMLIIACINYMNMATARSSRRAREVGIRKVLGSLRGQLISQFLAESVIIALFSLVFSLIIISLILPALNNMLDTTLEISAIFDPVILFSMVGILFLVGIIGGSYPAFYLSGFQPVEVLKSNLTRSGGNITLRKSLVWFQFVVSMGLLVSTGIVYDQLNYLQDKDLGFTKDPVVRFRIGGRDSGDKLPVLKQKLLQGADVLGVGTANSSPGLGYNKLLWNIENGEGVMEQKGIDNYRVDFEYFPTLEMQMAAGRNFDSQFRTDSFEAVMVNEAMVKRMGWKDAIGRKVQFGTSDTIPISKVIGVVKDFHQRWLYDPIEPLMFLPSGRNPIVHARINKLKVKESLAFIQAQWQEVFPNTPFEYTFVNDEFFAQYEADQRRSKIFTLFSLLTILIACLGLLGLASFTAEQRTKEIGIRKVIGAEVKDIIVLLTRDFIILVALATPFAFLASWLLMKGWLDDFSYHTDFKAFTFIMALVLTTAITILTTGYHALKAAKSDPIKALRHE